MHCQGPSILRGVSGAEQHVEETRRGAGSSDGCVAALARHPAIFHVHVLDCRRARHNVQTSTHRIAACNTELVGSRQIATRCKAAVNGEATDDSARALPRMDNKTAGNLTIGGGRPATCNSG